MRELLKTGLACALAFGLGALTPAVSGSNLSQKLALWTQVLQLIQSQALNAPNEVELVRQGIRGMLASLNDPYSSYLDPESFAALNVEKGGQLVGLGLELAYREQAVYVMSVLENTPASRSALRPGDQILAIDGVSVAGLNWAEINRRLTGEAGQAVSLRYLQAGQTREERLTRQVLNLQAVRAQALPGQICYLKITTFLNENLHQQVSEQFQTLSDCGQGLVLDLQNNPGGLLTEAVKVAGLLGVEGPVVYMVSRQGQIQALRSEEIPLLAATLPLVVLTNRGTASAAEILAAALQESGRAFVIGQTTFGKGLVQSLLPLEDGSGLSLTTARYLTRRRQDLQQNGIEPDFPVISIPGENQALEQAVRYLRQE